MQIVYTHEEAPLTFNKSIFLAGPSLRPGQEMKSWREEAVKFLEEKGYDGVVFLPENRDGVLHDEFDYDAQVS